MTQLVATPHRPRRDRRTAAEKLTSLAIWGCTILVGSFFLQLALILLRGTPA